VSLVYRSDPTVEAAGDEEGIRAALAQGLAERRSLDERRRFTGFGPQADDLEIGLSGALARTHASQGQLRSLMLALKLAELTEVSARLSDPPILLLDDVPSELDPSRRGLLFEVITRLDCQTLISVTEREIVPSRTDRLDFQVRAGSVAAVS
jgi:DNA replication and repair protein RecF